MQRPTWVRARVDFDFKNNHYTPGQVFTVGDPLDAVLLIADRRVEIAKKPAASAPEPEPAKRRSRRTYATKDMVAKPVATVTSDPVAADLVYVNPDNGIDIVAMSPRPAPDSDEN